MNEQHIRKEQLAAAQAQMQQAYGLAAQKSREASAKMGAFSVLTHDIVIKLLQQFIEVPDLLELSLTCKAFRSFALQESLWYFKIISNSQERYLLEYKDTWYNSTANEYRKHLAYYKHCTKEGKPSDEFEIPPQVHVSARFPEGHPASLYLQQQNCLQRVNLSGFQPPIERIPRVENKSGEWDGIVDMRLPQMFVGIGHDWPAMKWSLESLQKDFGDVVFQVEAPVNSIYGRVYHPRSITLSTFVHYAKHQQDEDPLYVFDARFGERNPEMAVAYSVPKMFQEDFLEGLGMHRPDYRWLLIGPQRSGSKFHQDPNMTSAWNTLIAGYKRWAIYPPHQVPPGVKVDFTREGDKQVKSPSALQWYLSIYPRLHPRLKPFEILQRPGETIHVPHGWWHAVLNLTDTIAITQNRVDRYNFAASAINFAFGDMPREAREIISRDQPGVSLGPKVVEGGNGRGVSEVVSGVQKVKLGSGGGNGVNGGYNGGGQGSSPGKYKVQSGVNGGGSNGVNGSANGHGNGTNGQVGGTEVQQAEQGGDGKSYHDLFQGKTLNSLDSAIEQVDSQLSQLAKIPKRLKMVAEQQVAHLQNVRVRIFASKNLLAALQDMIKLTIVKGQTQRLSCVEDTLVSWKDSVVCAAGLWSVFKDTGFMCSARVGDFVGVAAKTDEEMAKEADRIIQRYFHGHLWLTLVQVTLASVNRLELCGQEAEWRLIPFLGDSGVVVLLPDAVLKWYKTKDRELATFQANSEAWMLSHLDSMEKIHTLANGTQIKVSTPKLFNTGKLSNLARSTAKKGGILSYFGGKDSKDGKQDEAENAWLQPRIVNSMLDLDLGVDCFMLSERVHGVKLNSLNKKLTPVWETCKALPIIGEAAGAFFAHLHSLPLPSQQLTEDLQNEEKAGGSVFSTQTAMDEPPLLGSFWPHSNAQVLHASSSKFESLEETPLHWDPTGVTPTSLRLWLPFLSFLERQWDMTLDYYRLRGYLPQNLMSTMDAYLPKNLVDLLPIAPGSAPNGPTDLDAPSLIHGDLGRQNIILSPESAWDLDGSRGLTEDEIGVGGTVGIIDFADGGVGDPMYDLVQVFASALFARDDAMRKLVEVYAANRGFGERRVSKSYVAMCYTIMHPVTVLPSVGSFRRKDTKNVTSWEQLQEMLWGFLDEI